MNERWDVAAMRAGGILALVVAVPAFVGASWASNREMVGVAAVLSFVALGGFMLGAACAAWVQRLRLPLAHGLVTAIVTYLLVQVVVSVYRLVRGDAIDLFVIFFYLTLAALAGLLGGLVGQRLRSVGFLPSHERGAGAEDAS